jgi:hypothetical protein
MYNPTLGLFVQRDPIAADPNLYRYCGNNPVSYTDPDGMQRAPGMTSAGKNIDKNESTEKGKALGDLLKEDKELRRRLIDKAKETDKKERGGVVTKPTDPKKGNKHTVVEETSKENDELNSDIRTWGKRGKWYVPKPDSNDRVDLDKIQRGTVPPNLSEEDIVISRWHTHTKSSRPGPSDRDIRKREVPLIMIEKSEENEYTFWIVDENGDFFMVGEWKD